MNPDVTAISTFAVFCRHRELSAARDTPTGPSHKSPLDVMRWRAPLFGFSTETGVPQWRDVCRRLIRVGLLGFKPVYVYLEHQPKMSGRPCPHGDSSLCFAWSPFFPWKAKLRAAFFLPVVPEGFRYLIRGRRPFWRDVFVARAAYCLWPPLTP